MKPFLKIHIEVGELTEGDDGDGIIVSERRIYPIEFAREDSYHSYLTYEALDMLSKIRKALP